MVSLGLGIFGGLAKGFGSAQLEKLKADAAHDREVALATLNQNFQQGLQTQRIQFEQGEGRENRAQQKELTTATLAQTAASQEAQRKLEERLGVLSSDTTKAGYASTASNVDKQLAAQRDIAMAGIASDEKRTDLQIAANKELAQIQQAGAWTPTQVKADDKTSKWVLMNSNGDTKEMPLDKNGKPYDLVVKDTDTDDARNYKFMVSQGVDNQTATRLAFGAKAADPDALALGYFDALSKSASAGIKPLDPDAQTELHRMADLMAGKVPGAGAAASATGVAALPMPMTDGRPDTTKMVSGKRYVSPAGGTGTWDGTQIIPD